MQQLAPELPAHREDGRALDDDEQAIDGGAFEAEQVAGEDQVPGAGDGQEFGDAFDQAEDDRVEKDMRARFLDRRGRVRGRFTPALRQDSTPDRGLELFDGGEAASAQFLPDLFAGKSAAFFCRERHGGVALAAARSNARCG